MLRCVTVFPVCVCRPIEYSAASPARDATAQYAKHNRTILFLLYNICATRVLAYRSRPSLHFLHDIK